MFSIGGASFGFIAIMLLLYYGVSLDFVYGGILDMSKVSGMEHLVLVGFILAFFGFGVKASIFPVFIPGCPVQALRPPRFRRCCMRWR